MATRGKVTSINGDPRAPLLVARSSYASTDTELSVRGAEGSGDQKATPPVLEPSQPIYQSAELASVVVDGGELEDELDEEEEQSEAQARSRLGAYERKPFPADEASFNATCVSGVFSAMVAGESHILPELANTSLTSAVGMLSVSAMQQIKRTQLNAGRLEELYDQVEKLRLTVVQLKELAAERLKRSERDPILDRDDLAKASVKWTYAAAATSPVAGGSVGYLALGKPAIALGALIGFGVWGCVTGCRRGQKADNQGEEMQRLKFLRGEFEVEIERLKPIVASRQQVASAPARNTSP